ncbi:ribosome silencing factor [Tepidimicrobium xylanilyticum]|uniref:Ribosomal silencing factor RsfS n=1 Tax=Tepidimicrobium xylanilyticum TaxID=1123352 RepID=A0A1H3BSD0_9FIRM|nr:ribosome silencing factor [Tepidimicrobium xylanilyticum]SDX44676.1 ribosome-associated protein [Tepidimicrobium xylanilyticum]
MKDKDKITVIVNACQDKKGFDIKILDISKLTPITDYFVLVSGNSTTQVESIADEVEDKMYEAGYEPLGKEGKASSRWILIDYGDVIVHVFHREDREFYALEKLWADGVEVPLDPIL